MKFRFFSIFVLAGLLLNSCAVDELPAEGGSIVAEMETDQTRTTVTDEGTFTWSAGDQIWLHTTSGSVVGTLSDGAGSSNAKFSHDAFIGEMTGKAVYPYNSGHSVSGDLLNFVLPASYDLGSSLTNTNAAMYGVHDGGTIRFNHLAGVMRFKFKNVPAGVNKFIITLDKKINGTFTADLTADYPVIQAEAISTKAYKTVSFNFDALTQTSEISLYVPLPLGTYDSLDLALFRDEEPVWTYSNSVTNEVKRKSLILMPVVSLKGSINGEIEAQMGDYIDEYNINHGSGIVIDARAWAPVNCGYHKDYYPYGKLYQWGRKYGQGYAGEFFQDSSHPADQYEDGSETEILRGPVTADIGQSQDNSLKFYYNSSYPYDWLNNRNNQLWNSGTEENPVKTDWDPCPSGWRVPTKAELNSLLQNKSTWTTDESGQGGIWFSGSMPYSIYVPQIFFPGAGHRDYCDGKADYRGRYGRYWSSHADINDASYLSFVYGSTDVRIVGTYYKAFGFSVRCVQVTD